MEPKEIKKFLESGAGKAMKEYLTEARRSLWSIYRIKEVDDPVELAIEIKAQKKALYILDEILGDIMRVEQQKEAEEKKAEDNLAPGLD